MPISPPDLSRPLPPFERPPANDRTGNTIKAFMTLIAAGVIAGCAGGHGSSLMPNQSSSGLHQASNISRALPAASPTPAPADQAACNNGGDGKQAACQVQKKPGSNSQSPVGGLTPAQLRSVYGLAAVAPSTAVPTGPIVAIVAAYDDGDAEKDLGIYRKQFGLPQCTGGNHCFQKIQMKPAPGGPPPAPKPPGNSPDAVTWNDEISLDLAMASAACPTCRLLLVEALGQDLDSLSDAVNTAASYGPVAISNSWGVPEGGGNIANIDPDAQAAFNHPGIAITASAGDLGIGQVQFPASSPFVTAVGGTTLAQDGSARGWSESVWSGSGNGCSAMVAAPAWQPAGSCTGRAVPDVSMLADSAVGVAVYSSAEKGWVVLGGTSVGAPFVAGLYAAANDYGAGTIGAPSLYAALANLNAVNGAGPSPNGLAGF